MASRLNVGALSFLVVLIICTISADGIVACPEGSAQCGNQTKCKTNIHSDVNNCGGCGQQCPPELPNALSTCSSGVCGLKCGPKWANCDGNATNGCETSLTNTTNCGKCGKVCVVKNGTTALCTNGGKCQNKCLPGYSKCHDGCANFQADANNCGHCGKVCPSQPPLPPKTEYPLTGICYHGVCKYADNCFPGDATVRMEYGVEKKMTELLLGDKVAVMKPDGSIVYEDVYVFGHRDPSAMSSFLQLTLKSIDAEETRNLELTALHFVPISTFAGKMIYKRAADVAMGDKMWVEASSGVSTMFVVTGITEVTKQGLYNPYTLGGTIIVNGVVASAHSEWFLDGLFQSLSLMHLLPAVYQMVLLPVRMLYTLLGKDLYIALYQRFDAQVNIAEVGRHYAGTTAIATTGVASAVVALCMSRKMSKKA